MASPLYIVAHIVGLIFIFIGYGCLLTQEGSKAAMKWQGIGLLISFVTGFGMLGALHLMKPFPTWAMAKVVLWLVLGGLPVLAKRRVLAAPVVVLIAVVIGAGLAYLGLARPQLW